MTYMTEAPHTSAVVDVPLVRVYNFLRKKFCLCGGRTLIELAFYAELLSLTYQLEILIFQAVQLREFGWKNSLGIKVVPDRKSLTVQYWVLVAFHLLISPSADLLSLRALINRLSGFLDNYRPPPPPPNTHAGANPSAAFAVAAASAARNSTTAQVGGEIIISIVSEATSLTNQTTTSSI